MSFDFETYKKNIDLIEYFLKYILKNVDGNYSPITTTYTETKIEDELLGTEDKLHEDGLEIIEGNSELIDGSYTQDVGNGAKIKITVVGNVAKILKVLNHGSGYTEGAELQIAKKDLGKDGDNSNLTIRVNTVFSLFDIFNKNVDPTNKDTLKKKKNKINFIKKSRNLKYKIIKNIAYKNTIKTHISAKHYFNNIINNVNNDKISYYIDFNNDYDLINDIIQHYRYISDAYFGKISIKLTTNKKISFIDINTDTIDVSLDDTSKKKYGSIKLTIKASSDGTFDPNINPITITKIDTTNLNKLEQILTNKATDNYSFQIYDKLKNEVVAGDAVSVELKLIKKLSVVFNPFENYSNFIEILEINDSATNEDGKDVINHIEIKDNIYNLENAMNELKYNNKKQKELLNKHLAVYLGPIIFEKYNLIDILVFCIIILISVLLYFLRTYMSVYISGILLLVVVLIITFLAIIFN